MAQNLAWLKPASWVLVPGLIAGIGYTLYVAYPRGDTGEIEGGGAPSAAQIAPQTDQQSEGQIAAGGQKPGANAAETALAPEISSERPNPYAVTEETDAPDLDDAPADVVAEGAEAPAENVDVAEDVASEPAEPVEATGPRVDVVRIPPDGITTIAGQAAPGAIVQFFVDGAEVATAEAGPTGEFVALFDLPPSDQPRELTLALKDGEVMIPGAEAIIVAPAAVTADAPESAEVATDVAPAPTAGVEDTGQEDASDTAPASPPAAPTVLKADNEGLKVLQQDGTAPAALRIDAISYDGAGEVFVSGRGPAGSALRIYLDNALFTEATIAADGQWRQLLADLAPGRYALRVDQVDAGGAVQARVESPFQREDLSTLARVSGAGSDTPSEVAAGSPGQSAPSPDVTADADDAADEGASGLSGGQSDERASDPAAGATDRAAPPRVTSVTVQPGNTLWALASETYGDGFQYVRLFDANKDQIRDPDLIYPGQVFVLPQ